MSDSPHLIHVYKASAGSGKTFTLAAEFIANLINDFEIGDASYRHQLAITFTKKATVEMKERILQHLYLLAQRSDASDAFFRAVRESVPAVVTDRQIRERARRALLQIIHGYDFFHVTTIDSFFQSLLTNLAHELGLSAGFKVDLNDGDVLGKGVDRLLHHLRPGSEVLQWVTDYIEERLDEDKSWNVAHQLKDLAAELLKEPYLVGGDRLRNLPLDNTVVGRYRRTLRSRKNDEQSRLQRIGRALHEFIEQTEGYARIANGRWLQSFLGRYEAWTFRTPADYFPSATLTTWSDEPERMLKKADRSDAALTAWATEVGKQLQDFFAAIESGVCVINSCDLSMRHLNPLRLLDEIDRQVREINHENNAFMLAHTPLLFSKMVSGQEASFVFERAGTQFRHIMIDEFQDTSPLQWINLRHLFVENIAQGNTCMLVGDVKQGIYRFRGGDWAALAAIAPNAITRVEQLDSNFRSGRNIVEFNNRFFVAAARCLEQAPSSADPSSPPDSSSLARLYARDEVCQEAKNEGGFVRIRWFESSAPSPADASTDVSSTESVEQDLASQILRLHATGVPFEKMAILVRRKREALRILRYFEADAALRNIPLVSDEAFLLSSSPAVQTIVHALRYLVRPDDGIARAYLLDHCPAGQEQSVFAQLDEWGVARAGAIPFYDLVQRIMALFLLHRLEGQSPYLYAFLDAVLQFLDDGIADIRRFLTFWEEVLQGRSIPSTVVKGVRILTIHKSKGLAFHSVFIPYCDWTIERDLNGDLLWCEPSCAPYDAIPLLPIPMTSRTECSIYRDDYRREHRNRRIENLNLMYVAFTRARQNLIVSTSSAAKRRAGGAPEKASTMFDVLRAGMVDEERQLLPLHAAAPQGGEITDTESLTYECGIPSALECTSAETPLDSSHEHHPLVFDPQVETVDFRPYAARVSFRQSHNARAFHAALLSDSEEAPADNTTTDEARRRGLLLHRMMERIECVADIDRVVEQFAREGQILSPPDRDAIDAMLRRALRHPIVAEWFDGSWQLYRESSILLREPDGRSSCRRPDRVMMRGTETIVVDYKFGRTDPSYHRQVRDYCRLLRNMGRRSTRGYLWYVASGEVEAVVLDD